MRILLIDDELDNSLIIAEKINKALGNFSITLFLISNTIKSEIGNIQSGDYQNRMEKLNFNLNDTKFYESKNYDSLKKDVFNEYIRYDLIIADRNLGITEKESNGKERTGLTLLNEIIENNDIFRFWLIISKQAKENIFDDLQISDYIKDENYLKNEYNSDEMLKERLNCFNKNLFVYDLLDNLVKIKNRIDEDVNNSESYSGIFSFLKELLISASLKNLNEKYFRMIIFWHAFLFEEFLSRSYSEKDIKNKINDNLKIINKDKEENRRLEKLDENKKPDFIHYINYIRLIRDELIYKFSDRLRLLRNKSIHRNEIASPTKYIYSNLAISSFFLNPVDIKYEYVHQYIDDFPVKENINDIEEIKEIIEYIKKHS